MLINFDRPLGQQFKNLFRGLVIPYILFEFIYISLLFAASKAGLKFANAINDYSFLTVSRYIYNNPIGAYWYLHTLIIGLAISYIANKIFANKMSVIISSAIACWLVGYVITGFTFAAAVFIILGLILNFYQIQIKPSWLSLPAMLIICYLSLPYLTMFSTGGIALAFLVISLLFWAYITLPHNKTGGLVKRYFSYLGRNTLIIVLIHPIFLNILKPLSKYIIAIDHSGVLYLLIATFITITVCCYCSKLMDAIGLNKLLFGKKVYVPMEVPLPVK